MVQMNQGKSQAKKETLIATIDIPKNERQVKASKTEDKNVDIRGDNRTVHLKVPVRNKGKRAAKVEEQSAKLRSDIDKQFGGNFSNGGWSVS